MEEEKKKRTVHRRTKEQREFLPWIKEHLIPMAKENFEFFESFCRKHIPKQNTDKQTWSNLHSKLLEICEWGKSQEFFNFFNYERLKQAKWQDKHSVIYFIRADDDIRYALGFIDKAHKCNDLENPEELDQYDYCMYQILTHLYSYLCTQEK